MKTITVTPEEMESRIARFGQITPQSNSYSEADGIPKEAYEMLTAKTLYLLMSPESQGGPMAQQPAVVTKDKMSVICLLYTSPSPRDLSTSRMPSSA